MNSQHVKRSLRTILLLLAVCGSSQVFAEEVVATFPTYHAAVTAFLSALTTKDNAAVTRIIGAKALDLLDSGDATQDDNARLSFLKQYREAHAFVRQTPDKILLTVGKSGWELPFPIVRVAGVWHFDADEGAQELVYRRIGQNELDAIKVCGALVAAQKAYAAKSHDGIAAGTYAQHFRSEPGTQNGLYWEAKDGAAESPAGELVAEATNEGYSPGSGGKPTPFHGYYYRILTSQGGHAPGGAKDYVKDGKMTGGFAILAYPAEYRGSGVMTFVVTSHGKVMQKDLGDGTEENAKALVSYDPDDGWHAVR
jgi:Protein of unknown function (DUF2950)